MALLGMDVDAVRSFANQLMLKAEELEAIVNSLTSQLDGVQWLGTDANGFRADWVASHRPQLVTISGALREAATVANHNATQQEQTSSS